MKNFNKVIIESEAHLPAYLRQQTNRLARQSFALMARSANSVIGSRHRGNGRYEMICNLEFMARSPGTWAVAGDTAWYDAWWERSRQASIATGEAGRKARHQVAGELLERVLNRFGR